MKVNAKATEVARPCLCDKHAPAAAAASSSASSCTAATMARTQSFLLNTTATCRAVMVWFPAAGLCAVGRPSPSGCVHTQHHHAKHTHTRIVITRRARPHTTPHTHCDHKESARCRLATHKLAKATILNTHPGVGRPTPGAQPLGEHKRWSQGEGGSLAKRQSVGEDA